VAAQLIIDDGVDSVTMESVAAAAGVSKGLGYAYFDDRGDLLMAVLNRETHLMERRIGRAVARRARGLGIETWASDPVVAAGEIAAAGVTPVSFQDLLRGCGAVTLHLPLTKDSEHLIGARELALMPPGSYLINAARGPLVDLDAMLAALDSGQLAGAAIDVLPVEPPTREHPVPSHPRLIVTPHAAWYSPQAELEVYRRACLCVRAVIEGRTPADAVSIPGAKNSA